MKLVIAFFGILSVVSVTATGAFSVDRFREFSEKCGVRGDFKSEVFAADDGEHWKKYASQERVPEPNSEWAEGALVTRSTQGAAALIEGEGQDFSDSSLYCFDERGNLSRIEREFRTAWGWGYSEDRLFKNGALGSHQEHFFDTTTKATIARPAGADGVREALQLKLYKKLKELPFFKLSEMLSDKSFEMAHLPGGPS